MRTWTTTLALGVLIAACGATGARAQITMIGTLTAEKPCPAFRSFRQGTNPGNVNLEPGQEYALIAKNRPDATHYRIRIDGADPTERWVEIGCGTVSADDGDSGPAQPGGGTDLPLPSASTELLLAMSWQPAFCELRSTKVECRTQTEDRADAKNFSLHGLWPQPRGRYYCNIPSDLVAEAEAKRWDELPEIVVSPETRTRLDAVMPGTMSHLDRYQWTKHGSCYGTDQETYFRDSARIMEAINGSAVKTLVASRIGQKVTSEEIRSAFEQSFGAGAGQRVTMQCKRDGNRLLIVEIKVGLVGNPSTGAPVGDLIAAARPVAPECREGLVDRVGLQ